MRWKRRLASAIRYWVCSAAHFSISASYFTNVRVVAVVGGDFTSEEEQVFQRHNVDLSDLERIPEGKTFFWSGRYNST